MAYEACTLNLEGLQSSLAIDFAYLDEEWTGPNMMENLDQEVETLDTCPLEAGLEWDVSSKSDGECGHSSYVGSTEDSSMLQYESASEPVDGDDEDASEFDAWKTFDEDSELDARVSDEEKLKELEDILTAEQYAQLWEDRALSCCLSILEHYILNLISCRWFRPHRY